MFNRRALLLAALFVCPTTASAGAASPGRHFATPDEAVEALLSAAVDVDFKALETIFGPELIRAISTGDHVADKLRLQQLGEKLRQKREIVSRADGTRIVEAGDARWPFPVPIVQKEGRWYFDSVAGAGEIVSRRIGENEIRAIRILQFYVDAQRLYQSRDRDGSGPAYAARLISTPGRKDGLYWPTAAGESSPFGSLVGKAFSEGYGKEERRSDPLYQGYHYRVLSAQGAGAPGGSKSYFSPTGRMTEGFALLAYPSRWGISGIMSFVVGTDGTVYQKNLGEETSQKISEITKFDPGGSWQPIPAES